MAVDRRTFFLSTLSAVPIATLPACQRTDPTPAAPPTYLKALRELRLDDVEPAIVFVPLRRPT